MKKVTINLLITLLALLLICVSCKEAVDGIYKPNKQIAKVYGKMSGFWAGIFGDPALLETWIWNNDRLEEIVYENSFWEFGLGNNSSIKFYYDGDRLSKMIADDGTVYSINYNGTKFDKIYVENNRWHLSGTYTFKHTNGRITKVTYEESLLGKAGKRSNKSMNKMLEFLLPARTSNMLSEEVEYLAQNAISKAGEYNFQVVMKLYWNGDNVKKATIVERDDSESYKEVNIYRYDSKKNPYTNFFGGEFDAKYASANNIISIKTREDGDTDTETISYQYDTDGYPIQITYDLFGMMSFGRPGFANMFNVFLIEYR